MLKQPKYGKNSTGCWIIKVVRVISMHPESLKFSHAICLAVAEQVLVAEQYQSTPYLLYHTRREGDETQPLKHTFLCTVG